MVNENLNFLTKSSDITKLPVIPSTTSRLLKICFKNCFTLFLQGSKNHDAKSPRAHAAAMTVQKNWRNHQNKDLSKDRDVERVQHLKEEVCLKSDMRPEKEIGGFF